MDRGGPKESKNAYFFFFYYFRFIPNIALPTTELNLPHPLNIYVEIVFGYLYYQKTIVNFLSFQGMFYRLKMEYLIYIYLDVKFSDLGIDFKHFLKINMIGKSQKYDTQ